MVRGKIQTKSHRPDWHNIVFWAAVIVFCTTVWGLAAKGLFCLLSESL